MYTKYRRLMEVFNKGELIKIKETGEVFVYEDSTGGANMSSYLIVNVSGVLVEYRKTLMISDVEKVDTNGVAYD